ncbi:hypothetical protein BC939DRAFT_455419 [Gamsiella multidivaricata]|uniref:uncharacterized protein n=1 Tax=Gamsiella multidivaricata TaxID=101098 RepID=UPI00221F4550|nr:uncharacterized protein BC939DRAFT_455419 [Gamsiella multidivaricata]KAI7821514.1 hypothetical protein BC939DRAFT_455419 [Gamsiella multidivaricata]
MPYPGLPLAMTSPLSWLFLDCWWCCNSNSMFSLEQGQDNRTGRAGSTGPGEQGARLAPVVVSVIGCVLLIPLPHRCCGQRGRRAARPYYTATRPSLYHRGFVLATPNFH